MSKFCPLNFVKVKEICLFLKKETLYFGTERIFGLASGGDGVCFYT